jgi:acyl-CoA synthetase (AMP-forming)/AMP-acid ligase II
MCGAKLVLPGPHLSGENIYRLLREERCNFSLGVPTVWLGLFDYIERNRAALDLSEIALERLIVGGSAAPRAMIQKFEELFGAYVIHAWGMSETSPLATSTASCLSRSATTCRPSRAAPSTACRSRSSARTASRCRTTARPSAT